MSQFRMKLLPCYFDELEKGTKYIEIRCNDEKRREIRPGDQIIFKNIETEKEIRVEVIKLEKYSSFEKLIRNHPVEAFGFHNSSVDDVIKAIHHIYPQNFEKKYGALGIILNANGKNSIGE